MFIETENHKSGKKDKVDVPGSGTALRHELQDLLPKRLKNIIIEGKNIENNIPESEHPDQSH